MQDWLQSATCDHCRCEERVEKVSGQDGVSSSSSSSDDSGADNSSCCHFGDQRVDDIDGGCNSGVGGAVVGVVAVAAAGVPFGQLQLYGAPSETFGRLLVRPAQDEPHVDYGPQVGFPTVDAQVESAQAGRQVVGRLGRRAECPHEAGICFFRFVGVVQRSCRRVRRFVGAR